MKLFDDGLVDYHTAQNVEQDIAGQVAELDMVVFLDPSHTLHNLTTLMEFHDLLILLAIAVLLLDVVLVVEQLVLELEERWGRRSWAIVALLQLSLFLSSPWLLGCIVE